MFRPKNGGSKKLKAALFLAIFTAIAVTPVFALSDHKDDLYVNADAHGYEDGSVNHPYDTISQAIYEADSSTDIHVAGGHYKDNITLKKNIKLLGEDNGNTVIEAKKDKWAVVTNFTIKDGRRGIWIESHAQVTITHCIIKNNNQDGIVFEGNDTSRSNGITISNNKIEKNGMSGIYGMGGRRIVITDNNIYDNDRDGINLARGTKGWIGNNEVDNNNAMGVRLVLDGSNIYTKGNEVQKNTLDGFGIVAFGGAGIVNIEKTNISGNGQYAIARIAGSPVAFSNAYWKAGLTFSGLPNYISGNRRGAISGIINR